MRSTWWKSGQFNVLCDVCGFKFKSIDLRQRWDGLMVCQNDWETRHPQELIRPIQDQNKLPWTRPEPPNQYVSVTYSVVPQALVTIPNIVISTSDVGTVYLSTLQGTVPVGQVIVPVYIETGVSLGGLVTGTTWAVGTVFNVYNNSGGVITLVDSTSGSYTINQ